MLGLAALWCVLPIRTSGTGGNEKTALGTVLESYQPQSRSILPRSDLEGVSPCTDIKPLGESPPKPVTACKTTEVPAEFKIGPSLAGERVRRLHRPASHRFFGVSYRREKGFSTVRTPCHVIMRYLMIILCLVQHEAKANRTIPVTFDGCEQASLLVVVALIAAAQIGGIA